MLLSLDCMTLTNTKPVDLIRSARSAGFDLVSLWLQPPSPFSLQLVTPSMEKECAGALSDTGIRVHALEAFDLRSVDVVRSYLPALELGARLGATTAVAINMRNPDVAEVIDAFALFAEIAGQCGLGVNIEPVAICQTSTLAQARDIILAAGVDAGIVLDIYHLMRVAGTADDIRAIGPGLIRHVQVNDGVASPSRETIFIEAAKERPYPGDGVFPLVELLSAAPANISWGVEAPSLRRNEHGMSAQMQAQEAMSAMRRLLQKIDAVT